MLPDHLTELRAALAKAVKRRKLDGLGEAIFAAAEPCVLLYEAGEERTTIGEIHQAMRKIDPTMPAKLNQCNTNDLLRRWREHKPPPPLGASRFGGLPDLPDEAPWSEHDGKKLPLIAQLDLVALPRFDGYPLPEQGWLSVFAGGAHFPMRVAAVHHAGPREKLVRRPRPADAELLLDWTGAACTATCS